MKYILMMQFPLAAWRTQRLDVWPKQDQKAHLEFLKRFNQELVDAGEFVRTEGLGGPEQMKIVRASKSAAPAITDGPFPESKEVLAGYWVIDVETPQRALRARRARVCRTRARRGTARHADRGAPRDV